MKDGQEWIMRLKVDNETMTTNVERVGEIIRCKDCKRWKRNDGTFPDFDGKEWHECEALDEYRNMYTSKKPEAPAWFYCGYAERKEECLSAKH